MGHSEGAIRFDSDGVVMFCEYNGTSDVIRPGLMDKKTDVHDHWRHDDEITDCVPCPHIGAVKRMMECKHPEEDAEFVTTYGKGMCWPVKACRICKVVTGQLTPHDTTDENRWECEDGHPEWSPWFKEEEIDGEGEDEEGEGDNPL